MRVKTKQENVLSTPKRWGEQYDGTDNPKHAAITKKLNKLKPKTEKKIIDIIGNSSWTRLACLSCESDVDAVIEFRDDIPYEQDSVYICKDCLASALLMINQK